MLRYRAAAYRAAAIVLMAVGVAHSERPASAADAPPLVTIKQVMEKTMTPATNTLWGAAEQPTDDQWAALEEAAVTLLTAADFIGRGGAGPSDAEWASNPAWDAFNDVMTKAGLDALKAIQARDRDALAMAGDVLYPPCEGCHLQFNPAVVGEQ
jgi:cytochrome c556